ncbi:putative O-glycosylation ligase, exosortase A system-associated [Rhodoferax sp. UBA5149]|uniref:putative O-glycosylation ligase, exosortase A system-associated n=1 Tax=Rhodoferax sp. UBA5149 TaxID=1947379 RepID=UPI0025E46F60|nr:putative O-glycosylation ligase, exosortase A system-associated [Rhodoferax sp. UBA5149]
MRDLLMLGIVLGALPFALRHTWMGVLLWTWISIMNPHKLAWGFAQNAPWAAVVGGVTILSLFTSRDKLNMPWEPPVKVLFAFVIWMCVTTAFAMYPSISFEHLTKVLKIQLMTVIALAALRERKHIELFIWVNILSIGFYGLKGGLFTLRGGGAERVWGPPGGFIEGNNELAVAIVMVIPLINYLRVVATRPWIRHGLLALMLLCAVSVFGSQSRGALLAVSAMGLVLWLRSERKIVTGFWVGVIALALLAFMPGSWEQRMNTIGSYEQDHSAMGRVDAWKMTINLANRNFFGGGFEIYRPDIYAIFAPDSPQHQGAHSIYFSVLGEHGYVGLILFIAIWVLAFRTAGKLRQDAKKRAESLWLHHLAGMCQVSLVGYLVGGSFLALAYFDLPYNVLVVLVVSLRWLQEKRWESEPQGAFGAATASSSIPTIVRKRA